LNSQAIIGLSSVEIVTMDERLTKILLSNIQNLNFPELVLRAVGIKIAVFWDVTPCTFLGISVSETFSAFFFRV
jgi:hypothetical protein